MRLWSRVSFGGTTPRNGESSVCRPCFPRPDEMADLVAWIRRDEPGGPVHATWRPTRQRFGVLRWMSTDARLDIRMGAENPYVPRFVEAVLPPVGGRRQKLFPKDKNELVLATAWRFMGQKKDVLVYCSLRRSVETLGQTCCEVYTTAGPQTTRKGGAKHSRCDGCRGRMAWGRPSRRSLLRIRGGLCTTAGCHALFWARLSASCGHVIAALSLRHRHLHRD